MGSYLGLASILPTNIGLRAKRCSLFGTFVNCNVLQSRVGFYLTHKHMTQLESLVRAKHSSFFESFVNCDVLPSWVGFDLTHKH
jgi:hypothetical protein